MNIKNQKGAAAIEFALISPILFILVFGIIEFSIALYDKAMITNASREGARAGIVYNFPNPISDAEIRTVVNNYCAAHLISFGGGSAVSTTFPIRGMNTGDQLAVRVTYTYNFLVLPDLSQLFGGTITGPLTLQAETVMRME